MRARESGPASPAGPAPHSPSSGLQSTGAASSAASASELLAARVARADMALLVVTGLTSGGTRARVVLTLGAARKLAENARRRGVPCQVALVRLTPVITSPAEFAALQAVTQ